jgi:hypothetical protein
MLAVACSSPLPSANGSSVSSSARQPSPAATTAPTDGAGSSGSGTADVEGVYATLTPPDATEVSKTTAGGVIVAAFDSEEPLETVRQFFEDAFAEANLRVVNATTAQGGVAWAVTRPGDSSFGGAISIVPAADGTGTQISITIGSTR